MFYCNGCAKKQGYPITMFKSRGTCELCKDTADCNEMPTKNLPVPNKCQVCGSRDTEKVCQTEIFEYKDKKIEIPNYESIKCNNCKESVASAESVKRSEPLLRKIRLD